MWRSHSRISYVGLLEQGRFNNCSLYFRSLRLFALPQFCDGPKYLSRSFAEHFHYVVLRNFLRRMFEKNEMFFVASGYGPLGKSAWWLSAWFAYCWHFLRRGFAQTGLDKF